MAVNPRVEVAAAAIVASKGALTATQLAQLDPIERAALAIKLNDLGHAALVTWADDPVYTEREARAVAVDAGVKASRFTAALVQGQVDGATRDPRGRWSLTVDGFSAWLVRELTTPALPSGETLPPALPAPPLRRRRVSDRMIIAFWLAVIVLCLVGFMQSCR